MASGINTILFLFTQVFCCFFLFTNFIDTVFFSKWFLLLEFRTSRVRFYYVCKLTLTLVCEYMKKKNETEEKTENAEQKNRKLTVSIHLRYTGFCFQNHTNKSNSVSDGAHFGICIVVVIAPCPFFFGFTFTHATVCVWTWFVMDLSRSKVFFFFAFLCSDSLLKLSSIFYPSWTICNNEISLVLLAFTKINEIIQMTRIQFCLT